jgi:hypothetical protein
VGHLLKLVGLHLQAEPAKVPLRHHLKLAGRLLNNR